MRNLILMVEQTEINLSLFWREKIHLKINMDILKQVIIEKKYLTPPLLTMIHN